MSKLVVPKGSVLPIQLDTKEANIATADEKKILWRKPDGTEGEWIATNPSGTLLEYIPSDNTEIVEGTWMLETYLKWNSPLRENKSQYRIPMIVTRSNA